MAHDLIGVPLQSRLTISGGKGRQGKRLADPQVDINPPEMFQALDNPAVLAAVPGYRHDWES
jgi:hypothetical protein